MRPRSPVSSTDTAASAGAIQRRITFTSFGQLTKVPQTWSPWTVTSTALRLPHGRSLSATYRPSGSEPTLPVMAASWKAARSAVWSSVLVPEQRAAGTRQLPPLRGRTSMTSRFPSQFMRHGSAACSLRRSPEAAGLLRDCIMTAPPFPTRSRAKARESGTGPRSCGRAETGTRDNGWRTVGDGGCRDGISAVNGGLSSDAPSMRRSAPQDQTAGFVEISRSSIRCGNQGEEACSGGGCDRSRQASKP